jgi:integrase
MSLGDVANIGKVVSETMPGGRTRWRIDFGWIHGKRVRVNSIPSPAGAGHRISIADEAMANQVLLLIRADLIHGKSLEQALARYRSTVAEADLVEKRLDDYLAWWEQRVAQGKRSPLTLREIKRYAKAGGPWSWWFGRSVHDLTNADMKSWHVELGRQPISLATQKHISDAFRAFLNQLAEDEIIERVPKFPEIEPPPPDRSHLAVDTQERVIAAIPWEARGAFLVAACHVLRLGEIRALDLDDFDGKTIHLARAAKSARVGGPVGRLKNDNVRDLDVWDEELLRWLRWRVEQATSEARLRGEIALCPNPRAYSDENAAMRWSPSALRRTWIAACKQVGVKISFQEGTRHSTLTALATRLPERVLKAFSGHRSSKALDKYTTNVRSDPAEIREIMTAKRRRGP